MGIRSERLQDKKENEEFFKNVVTENLDRKGYKNEELDFGFEDEEKFVNRNKKRGKIAEEVEGENSEFDYIDDISASDIYGKKNIEETENETIADAYNQFLAEEYNENETSLAEKNQESILNLKNEIKSQIIDENVKMEETQTIDDLNKVKKEESIAPSSKQIKKIKNAKARDNLKTISETKKERSNAGVFRNLKQRFNEFFDIKEKRRPEDNLEDFN